MLFDLKLHLTPPLNSFRDQQVELLKMVGIAKEQEADLQKYRVSLAKKQGEIDELLDKEQRQN